MGQADGVACRTVEMFEAFGLANRLVDEAYWVNEVCFWRPDPEDPSRITRTGRILDTEEGLSEFPHVIVNQARMLAYLLDHMQRSPSRLTPFYGLEAEDVEVGDGVTVTRARDAGTRGAFHDPLPVRRRLRRRAQPHPRPRSAASWSAMPPTSPGA